MLLSNYLHPLCHCQSAFYLLWGELGIVIIFLRKIFFSLLISLLLVWSELGVFEKMDHLSTFFKTKKEIETAC
jgi:5-bromo-4-chloroindolyl phosphate hydrolysis protein